MPPIRLAELPPPPTGKPGWPWTVESPPLPDQGPGGAAWPRITVVTPSFNQARFIEATIRSVLLQGYPNVEYFVMDGGSTDETVEIIRKYSRWLAGWVSEKDRGQAHAINKGLERSTGELQGYQNSDDGYLPGAFQIVAEKYDQGHDLIYGHHVGWDADGRIVIRESLPNIHPHKYVIYASGSLFPEATFWSRPLREKSGWLKELRYSLDTEWFYRITEHCRRPCHVQADLAWFTHHEGRKTLERNESGERLGLMYEDHPLAGYLRGRGISRARQFTGALVYVPMKRLHFGRFPLPFPKWAVMKRFFKR